MGGTLVEAKGYRPKGHNLAVDCGKGFVFFTTTFALSRKWCPHCASEQRKHQALERIKKVHQLAEGRGGVCLNPIFLGIDSHARVRLRCSCGYEWEMFVTNLLKGRWCPHCAKKTRGLKRRTPNEVYHQYAQSKGGLYLGLLDESTTLSKSRFRCEFGHVWAAHAKSVLHFQSWCPSCQTESRFQYTHEKAEEIARSHDGRVLSPLVRGGAKYFEYECREGHRFKMSMVRMVKENVWCPYCAGTRTHISHLKKAAAEIGWKCLSDEYRGEKRSYLYLCNNGHKIFKRYHGSGVPLVCQDCRAGIASLSDFAVKCAEQGIELKSSHVENGMVVIQCTIHQYSWESDYRGLRDITNCCPFEKMMKNAA